MNGRVSKILKKASTGKRHYRRLKKQYNKIPAPEREEALNQLKEKTNEQKS